MSNNCPICNKAGLPDYTKNSVVCSQCNSNLKVFLLLNSISRHQKSNLATYIIIGISLLSIVFFGLFINSNSIREELISKNEFLNDSIYKIQNITIRKNGEAQPNSEKHDAILKYVVKKGDYPYKIAQFFFGEGNKYKQIEADNDLKPPYTLKVGQILKIKIPQ